MSLALVSSLVLKFFSFSVFFYRMSFMFMATFLVNTFSNCFPTSSVILVSVSTWGLLSKALVKQCLFYFTKVSSAWTSFSKESSLLKVSIRLPSSSTTLLLSFSRSISCLFNTPYALLKSANKTSRSLYLTEYSVLLVWSRSELSESLSFLGATLRL